MLFDDTKKARVGNLLDISFPTELVDSMAREVTDEEIRKTLFFMSSSKAPGSDGYSAGFIQKAWPVVGRDFMDTIKSFFLSG